MSNALAIAAVTAVLRDLLENALIAEQVPSAVGGIDVSVLTPGRIAIDPTQQTPTQLNLFLYQVMQNSGWANARLPTYDSSGRQVNNTPLALDLRYLLTAYGTDAFEAEILLGYGMQVLHETTILPSEKIRKALRSSGPVSGSILPNAFKALSAAELADQIESIKISPVFLSLEEMSQLWSMFQMPYSTSMAYHVSTVLIEGRRSTTTGLPVQRFFAYGFPIQRSEIKSLAPPDGLGKPIIAGKDLIITGHRLRGEITKVSIDGTELSPAREDISDQHICVTLPSDMRPGVHSVQVVQYKNLGDPPTPHIFSNSNVSAFLLPPQIEKDAQGKYSIVVANPVDETIGRKAKVTITVSPPVERGQRILLLLNQIGAPAISQPKAYSFTAAPFPMVGGPTFKDIVFQVQGMTSGKYLVRLQVEGAESVLETDTTGKYVHPNVEI